MYTLGWKRFLSRIFSLDLRKIENTESLVVLLAKNWQPPLLFSKAPKDFNAYYNSQVSD